MPKSLRAIGRFGAFASLLALLGCGAGEMDEHARLRLYSRTLRGEEAGCRVRYWETTPDTLFAAYGHTPAHAALALELARLDSLALGHIARRDSVFRAGYVPSRDRERSSHLSYNRWNDSAAARIAEGRLLREQIARDASSYGRQVRGAVWRLHSEVICGADTVPVRGVYLWRSFR
jgi:hypothetical protein